MSERASATFVWLLHQSPLTFLGCLVATATNVNSDDARHGGVNLEEFTATVKMVQLHQTFSAMDADGSGSVDTSELKGFLKDQGINVQDSKYGASGAWGCEAAPAQT